MWTKVKGGVEYMFKWVLFSLTYLFDISFPQFFKWTSTTEQQPSVRLSENVQHNLFILMNLSISQRRRSNQFRHNIFEPFEKVSLEWGSFDIHPKSQIPEIETMQHFACQHIHFLKRNQYQLKSLLYNFYLIWCYSDAIFLLTFGKLAL